MAYRLRQDEPVGDGVRRIAREQINKAIRELTDAGLERHVAVHQFRKRAKKIRGLIRLVRPALGDVYTCENRWYRDAARAFSRVRDAEAQLECLQGLSARFADRREVDAFHELREQFESRRRRIVDDGPDLDEAIAELAARLHCARLRIDGWRLKEPTFDDIAGGLRRTYRRGGRAFRKSIKTVSADRRHEWRKRAKYHWHHLRLLIGLWKPVIKSRRDELKRLADLLGDDHDLAVLRKTMTDEAGRWGNAARTKPLLKVIACRQAELRGESDPLGHRIFAEAPQQLAQRFNAYWSAWRT